MSRPLPVIGPARILPPLDVRRRVLDNGMVITVVERRDLPMVNVEIIVRGGAELDTARTAGRVSMMAEMLDEGTPTRGALEIAEQLDHLGAYFSVHTGWDSTVVSLHILSAHLDAAFAIIADVVLNAAFPTEEFRRKQKERLTALLQERDEPALLAGKTLAAGIFGAAHPYGTPVDGSYESVEQLTVDDVAAVYAERFQPNGVHVVIVGDVSSEEVTAAFAARFGGWQGQEPLHTTALPAVRTNGTRVLLVDKPGAAQAELRVGHAAPARGTEDYFALMVMNTVLGGSFTSRLNSILRERMGVTYGASSRLRLRRHGGLLTIGSAILTEAVARSAQVVIEEMARLQVEPVPPEELLRAQSYIALGLPRSFETTEDIGAHIREQLVHELPADYWQTYVDRVLAVTAADVSAAAARHLHPDACTIVVVADQKDVRDALEQSGLGDVVLTAVAM